MRSSSARPTTTEAGGTTERLVGQGGGVALRLSAARTQRGVSRLRLGGGRQASARPHRGLVRGRSFLQRRIRRRRGAVSALARRITASPTRRNALPRFALLAYPQLSKYFIVVLPKQRRRCVDARAAVREGEGGDRHAEAAVHAGHLVVAVDDAARGHLRIGNRLLHGAHAHGRHVARLQEFLPFVG